jgi:phage FluMu gp28-like protein
MKMVAAGNDAVGFAVAPTFWHTQKQWKEFLRYCPREFIIEVHRGEHKITLLGNREVWFRSCDNPDSLRSEGLDILWMDEGGQIKEDAWTMALRPALMDKKGKAFFTGTPKGKNWYFQLWTRGQDKDQTDYESWAFPSTGNPYIDPSEVADFARDMPEMAYKQEILAEFVDDVGSVFRKVDGCIAGKYEPYSRFKAYYMGVDLAKHMDFTVLCVLDNDGHLCAFDRFNQLDWVFQRKRIINLAHKYPCRILMDSTGVGDPVFDELKRSGLTVSGYKFTNASKKELIENLSIRIENREISYPNEPVLMNELKLFGYTVSPSGIISYGAPEGYHDDCVIALALAAWQTSRPRGHFGSAGVH